MKWIGLFLVLTCGLGFPAQAQNIELLGMLDGAKYIQTGPSTYKSDMKLVSLNRNGVARFDVHYKIANRPFICELTLISSGRYVSGNSEKCRFADNNQSNLTECNLFLMLDMNGKLKGKSFCNYLAYHIEMEINPSRDDNPR